MILAEKRNICLAWKLHEVRHILFWHDSCIENDSNSEAMIVFDNDSQYQYSMARLLHTQYHLQDLCQQQI